MYDLTPKGIIAAKEGTIILPVPVSIREYEQHEEEKKRKTLEELQSKGLDLERIPQEELEAGEGEAIAALKHWFTYLDSLQKRGLRDRLNQMDDLKSRIEAWRLDMAERYRMAPSSVMEEHLLVKVAYATANLRTGSRMEIDALIAAGVRSSGIEELTKVLGEWSEMIEMESKNRVCDDDGGGKIIPMSFKAGEVLRPANSWRFSVHKPSNKTGMAAWETSYNRFEQGEHPQTIAMTQKSGKPIQVATVAGHILDALVQGRPVDLHRLSLVQPPPTKIEWEELARCELETGMDVTADPATSGANGDKFTLTDFLVPIMGNEFVLKDSKERTREESAKFSNWCNHLRWYLALRRVGYEPSFSNSN